MEWHFFRLRFRLRVSATFFTYVRHTDALVKPCQSLLGGQHSGTLLVLPALDNRLSIIASGNRFSTLFSTPLGTGGYRPGGQPTTTSLGAANDGMYVKRVCPLCLRARRLSFPTAFDLKQSRRNVDRIECQRSARTSTGSNLGQPLFHCRTVSSTSGCLNLLNGFQGETITNKNARRQWNDYSK